MDGGRLAKADPELAATIRGAQTGDRACLDRLVEQFADRLYGFLYRLTGSRSDAEDLFQEVFVRVVRVIADYEHDGRFEAWLFRIAANLCRDRVRRISRLPKHHTLEVDDEADGAGAEFISGNSRLGGSSSGPDSRMARAEELDALGSALAQLPDVERTVIMLRHFSQMSFKEIAEVTEVPLGTALARAHRGLGRLRVLMGVETAEKAMR